MMKILDFSAKKTMIVLVDWMGYLLYRTKIIGPTRIPCGLGRILDNMSLYPPGCQIEVFLVINESDYIPLESCLKLRTKAICFRLLALLAERVKIKNAKFKEKRKREYLSLKERYPFIKHIFFRDNTGQDIGAYNLGYQFLREIGYRGDVVFMNSSLRGPEQAYWLQKYARLFHSRPGVGLCGISLNSHDTSIPQRPFAPHVQSFFLYSCMPVLTRVFPAQFPGSETTFRSSIISKGEIAISRLILEAGYSIVALAYPHFFYEKGRSWDIPQGDLRFSPNFQDLTNRL